MEELLRELLAVNNEILSEIRLLRQSLAPGDAPAPRQVERPAQPPHSRFEDPQAPAFEEAPRPKAAPPRTSSSDLEDIGNSLLDGIKKRNRDTSNAFSEFEKRHKNW